MTIATGSAPSRNTLRAALAVLTDPSWGDVLTAVLTDRVVLWLGSAISSAVAPDVKELLKELLAKLFERGWLVALAEIVDLSGLASDRAGYNFAKHPRDWPRRDQIVDGLWSKYSDALGVIETGQNHDAIIFDVLDLPTRYSEIRDYDADHRFAALLIAEGIVGELITTNWDSLIERAYRDLETGTDLRVVARPADVDGHRPRLLKIHGCAESAKRDPEFKKYLIATVQQIMRWIADPIASPYGDALRGLFRERMPIFVGISMQDHNLQLEYLRAGPRVSARPDRRPVFARHGLGHAQKTLLQNLYGDEEYARDKAGIESSAALPLWSKPFLGGLYVLCLCEKAQVLARKASLSPQWLAHIASGLDEILIQLCNVMSSLADDDTAWRWLAWKGAALVSRAVSIYRSQSLPSTDRSYRALYDGSVDSLQRDWNVPCDFRMVLVLGVLFDGAARGRWHVSLSGRLHFLVSNGTSSVELVFVRRAFDGMTALVAAGLVDDQYEPDVVILCADGATPADRLRSFGRPSRRLPGGIVDLPPREISLEELLSRLSGNEDLLGVIETVLAL